MPITIAAPPQQVPVFSGFDYVAMDERRERAYAAHTPSRRLLVVDTQSAKVLEQIAVGPLHGIAVDPATGIVFTGGTDDVVSKVDPAQAKVLAKTTVPGSIDAIAYDPTRGRIYADQADGNSLFVIDATTMKQIATDCDAQRRPRISSDRPRNRHRLPKYFLATTHAFAIVDPASLRVAAVVHTPAIAKESPTGFLTAENHVIVGGVNGVLSAYTPAASTSATLPLRRHRSVQQGALGKPDRLRRRRHVTLIADQSGAAPRLLGRLDRASRSSHHRHRRATGDVWMVCTDDAAIGSAAAVIYVTTASAMRAEFAAAERGARHDRLCGVVLTRCGRVDRPAQARRATASPDCNRASSPELLPSRCRTDSAEAPHSWDSLRAD